MRYNKYAKSQSSCLLLCSMLKLVKVRRLSTGEAIYDACDPF